MRLPIIRLVIGLASLTTALMSQDLVFRTSVDLITVDATVLGPDGRPTSDLSAADFVVKIDGQPRRIVSAQFVSQQQTGRATTPLYARHFSSNENADAGRLIVVAVDEAHIRRTEGRAALAGAARFIDRLDPLDRIAVTGLARLGTLQFTRDRVVLKQRLETLTGHTDPVFLQFNLGLIEAIDIADGGRAKLAEVVLRECGRALTEYTSPARATDETAARGRDACPEQLEQEARVMSQHARTQATISLAALEALVMGLETLEGPKSIVLLSEGMVLDPRLVDVNNLAANAKKARVSIYALHMEAPMFESSQDRVSPTFTRDVQLRGDGLERLAGATKGAVFRLVGSDPAPFDRITAELSGYYLLGVEATDRDRDGRVHRVDVTLARGGGLLRARNAFRLPPVVPSAQTREQELVGLLRDPRLATELPVRAATYTYAADPMRLRVVVSTEADVASGAASQVLMGYVLMDAAGVIAASGAQLTNGGRQAFSTYLPPGAYTLRVAAIDPLDRRGSVERPFAAAVETYGPVRVSDLILAPVAAAAGAPLQPLVDRIRGSQMTANIEIYPVGREPPANLRVVFEITPESGGASPVIVPVDVIRGAEGLLIARATLSLTGLSAGTYLTHARVIADGKDLARVTRPFSYIP